MERYIRTQRRFAKALQKAIGAFHDLAKMIEKECGTNLIFERTFLAITELTRRRQFRFRKHIGQPIAYDMIRDRSIEAFLGEWIEIQQNGTMSEYLQFLAPIIVGIWKDNEYFESFF